jgi:Xaa-Pro aminopeptidase
MRREKHARITAAMEQDGIEALWLMGPGNIRYLIGSAVLPADAARSALQPAALLILRDQAEPHLFTPYPSAAPDDLPGAFVHPPLFVESESGAEEAMRRIAEVIGGPLKEKLGIDVYSPALFFSLKRHVAVDVVDASSLIGVLKICKSKTEIECVRRAQAINERAMLDIYESLRPGLRQSDLSAFFFSRIFELGACANGIDPIWQVMSKSIAGGPYTTHGDVAFPTCTSDRILRAGDLLWVDTGIDYHGYQSDFGRTWLVGGDPNPRQQSHAKRWGDIVQAVLSEIKPGATGSQLTRTALEAAGGVQPWVEHFYLIHGIGSEPAEQPLIGTDLGPEFDARMVLAPGMILVLEPSIWDDGHGGYRSEEVVAVTEDGYERLSEFHYFPFAPFENPEGAAQR